MVTRYLAAGLVGVTVFALIPSDAVRGGIYVVIGAGAVISIVWGIARKDLAHSRGWVFIAAATALWFVADLLVKTATTIANPLYLLGYAAFTIGLVLLVDGTGRRLGVEEIADGAIVAVPFGLISWMFVVGGPTAMDSDSTVAVARGTVTAVAFTSLDVFLLVLVGYRLADRRSRTASTVLLSAAIATVAVADYLSYVAGAPDVVSEEVLQGSWLASFVLIAAAVAHRAAPSTEAFEPAGQMSTYEPEVSFERQRLVWLIGATLVTPAVMMIELIRGAPVGQWGWLVVACAMAIVLLVSFRMLLFVRLMKAQAAALTESSRTDPLTGLANRRFLGERLAGLVARDAESPVALLVVDLVRFSHINETYGYGVGDRVLYEVGARLLDVLGPDDLVCRLGGDEFVVVLAGDARYASAVESARTVAAAVGGPMSVRDIDIALEASVGIAVSSLVPRTDTELLLQRAHLAVTEAKKRQPRLAVYNRSMEIDRHESMRLMGELGAALTEGELRVYYQPRLDLSANRVAGVEALLRWQHPRDGLLTPARFLPSAEESGMLPDITAFVLDEALAQCGAWRTSGLDIEVALNLSVRNLLDPALPESVRIALERHALPGSAVAFEITESSAMTDPDHAVGALESLRRLGVSISIDDYGTGYSSLAYLKSLPVQQLKIDQSFVTTMTTDAANATIVRSTVDLARSLGVSVVAEGVEDEATLDALRALGCDGVQGYHVGRPVPWDEVAALIADIDSRMPTIGARGEF